MSERDSICAVEENPGVEYRDVPGFEGIYRVGSDGTVWTRRKRGRRASSLSLNWKRMIGSKDRAGYVRVTFFQDGERRSLVSVHRLVLKLFVGPCPDGMEACHWDGNTANNAVSNLRWDTHVGNHRDQKRHGTRKHPPRSDASGRAKLRAGEIRSIRREARDFMRSLEAKYGVSREQIGRILRRKAWRWTEETIDLCESK